MKSKLLSRRRKVYDVVVHSHLSHDYTICKKQLLKYLPGLSPFQRFLIGLWWCKSVPKLLRPLVIFTLELPYDSKRHIK